MSSFLGDGKAESLPKSELELLQSPSTPEDSCDYSDGEWKCGDSCLGKYEGCSCGSSGTISYQEQHCCTPPDTKCYKAPVFQSDSSIVVCSEGFILPYSTPCNTSVAS